MQTDVVIVGAGPVGLFTVFQCGMLGLKSHVIDTLEAIGGQCSSLYPEKPIYDIPAFPSISGQGLIDQLEAQAAPFKPTYHLKQQVISVEKSSNGWNVTTDANTTIQTKGIIIAAGSGAFGPNRPPLEGLSDYEGKSVFYAVRHMQKFAGKKIVIAGGGDSAVDWALALEEIAESISIVHRRPKFRAAPDSIRKLDELVEKGKITLETPYQLNSIEGENGQLEFIGITDLNGNEKKIPADILLPFFGLRMELGPISEWGLNMDKGHILVTPSTMETNEPGIYAVGDIAQYAGKLKLILTGFSEAALAAHSLRNKLTPDQPLHFEYSTTKGVPSSND